MASRKWRVWSRDPQSRRWMVVVDGTTEDDARSRADSMMATAWKYVLLGAAYVALPPGEKPSPEHDDLAVKLAEATMPEPDIRLSGTGTFVAEESPITMSGSARLSVASEALPPPKEATVGAAHLSLAPPPPVEAARFGRDAFVGTVGQVIPVRFGGQIVHWARVRDASVTDDGLTAYLTLDAASRPDEG